MRTIRLADPEPTLSHPTPVSSPLLFLVLRQFSKERHPLHHYRASSSIMAVLNNMLLLFAKALLLLRLKEARLCFGLVRSVMAGFIMAVILGILD